MPLSKDKKKAYFGRMKSLLSSYTKVFVVEVDNVGSQQLNVTRAQMRGTAEILMGKNTLMMKVFKEFLDENPESKYGALRDQLKGNVGFVFTNSDLPKVRDMIFANRVPAPARVGGIAPVDVIVPAGPTGADPGQTSFFQVLQIPTKIVKGQIEITTAVHLVKKGDKVEASQAALLTKLNIRPFSYGLGISCIYDNGSVFSVDILNIDEAMLLSKFSFALGQVAAISLQIGYPTQASIPHSIGNAYKNILAITTTLENYTFDRADAFFKALASGGGGGGGGSAPAAAGAGAAKAAVPDVPKEEEVDPLSGGMDMFGGGGGGGGGDY
jgi:large subunit ribosomal protein LP0